MTDTTKDDDAGVASIDIDRMVHPRIKDTP